MRVWNALPATVRPPFTPLTLTNYRQGWMHKPTQQFLTRGWRPTTMENAWGRDWWLHSWAETGPAQGGREPLWGLSRGSQDLWRSQGQSDKTYSSQVLHKTLKGICLFTRKAYNIRNNYSSQLNKVTKTNQNKTYYCKSSLKMYMLNVHYKCTALKMYMLRSQISDLKFNA